MTTEIDTYLIPGSYASVGEQLQVMIEVAGALKEFDSKNWPHLKNKEDYASIFTLPDRLSHPLDNLYCVGRQFAGDLADDLLAFRYIDEAPTLSRYVERIEARLSNHLPNLKSTLAEAEAAIHELESHTFAVSEMARVLKLQIELARVAQDNCAVLKRCPKYLVEQGKLRPGEEPRRFWDRPIAIALAATLLAGLLAFLNTIFEKNYSQEELAPEATQTEREVPASVP
ncbi:MAG: hypothetical protein AAGG55_03445 [Pseudomonadota bacterium]